MPYEHSIWIELYKNRLNFIYKSIDEFIIDMNEDKLENVSIYNGKLNKVEIYNIIIENIKRKDTDLENTLDGIIKKLEQNLYGNEKRFINELNIQDELSEKIRKLELEKIKYEKAVQIESITLCDGLEKMLNHFDNTMDKIKEKGLNSEVDRKGYKVVEILQCFKKNLYKYFMKVIINFKNPSCEFNMEGIIETEVSKQLEEVESNFAKYLFKQYITEIQWDLIIQSAKKYSNDYVKILKQYQVQVCKMVNDELTNKVNSLNELILKSLQRAEIVKKQRDSIEKEINEAVVNKEKISGSNEYEKIEKLNLFKKLISNNYINEYNKVVNLINSENILSENILVYYEYLYLITSEMEKVWGDLYG